MNAPNKQCELKDIYINVIIFAADITGPVDSYAYSMSPILWKNASNESSDPTIEKQVPHLLRIKKWGL